MELLFDLQKDRTHVPAPCDDFPAELLALSPFDPLLHHVRNDRASLAGRLKLSARLLIDFPAGAPLRLRVEKRSFRGRAFVVK
jgi:hypothetical protein